MRRPTAVVVHYSATYSDEDVTLATVRMWHKKRGFRTEGYHWFIRRNGMLEEGRPETEMGAHVTGHNHYTIGICFAGGLERATGKDVGVWNPTPAQEATMIALIHNIMRRWPSITRVVGHRNLAATQCPGRDDVAAWWAEASRRRPAPAPAPATVRNPDIAGFFKRMFGASNGKAT